LPQAYLRKRLVASSPLALAPVRSATEVLSATAEVASRTAQSVSALLVDNRSASLTLTRNTLLGSRLSRLVLVVALSEASLASVSTVDGLVLDVVLGACSDVSNV
jgi:hypothetical protein